MWMIPEEERAYYNDLSLIASKQELQEFSTTPLPEHDQYVKRFWKRHDPTLVTGGDIRRLEHYRRVNGLREHTFPQRARPGIAVEMCLSGMASLITGRDPANRTRFRRLPCKF
jgi:GWxTD domain-containing protein